MHNDGQTSYQRRWQKDHKAPLCEMAETVQYMIPTTKAQPKMEPRFFKGIWLGRDTMTGESIVGIPGKVIRARTIRRQIMPDKYDKQLLDTINVYPWNLPTPPMAIPPQLLLPADNTASRQAIGTQADITVEDTSTQTRKRHHWHYQQHKQCTISQWIQQWQHHHWQLHQQQWQDHHCQYHQQASDNTRSLQVKHNPNNQGQHSPQQQQTEDKMKNNQKQR